MSRQLQQRRSRLTVEEILDRSLALIDESGLERFSMRRLGTALGVDPMAIYHHVKNKQTVIALVDEQVLSGIEAPDPTLRWEAQIEFWARSYRRVVTAHPALTIEALVNPSVVRQSVPAATAPLRHALKKAGVTGAALSDYCDLVVDFVHGASLGAATAAQIDAPTRRRLQRAFDTGIATIIDGIKVRTRRNT